ncbi:hypothetical protein AB0H00_29035 [Nocardia sp. NPDC023852]|uniref:hypothetical protein n=1 Tax=Nocardia sp. NPDC023852 TaxID=3154697 RepID=UPI0033D2F770
MTAMTASIGTRADELSRLDARLLVLDPDLEGLFAEVDAALRPAREWRPPRTAAVPSPGSRRAGHRREPPRRQRRPPDPLHPRQRSPPGRSGALHGQPEANRAR